MRKVIYTCITGGYDALRQPATVKPDWDYICFTDNEAVCADGIWQFRRTEGPDAKTASRYPKILPHKVLPDYDVSLYIDSNLVLAGDAIYDAADAAIASGTAWAGVKHPQRDCIYEEIRKCYLAGHCRWRDAFLLERRLKKSGFPRQAGLLENNIILRKHNLPAVMEVDENWWKVFLAGPRRDQLHLMPLLRHAGIKPAILPELQRIPHARPFSSPYHRPRIIKNILKRFL